MYNNKIYAKMKTLVIILEKQTGKKRCRIYNGILSKEEIVKHVYTEIGEKLANWEYVTNIMF